MADSTEKTIAWSRSTFCNGADACVEVAFRKASASAAAGDCVEVGVCRCDGRDLVLVRDSKLGEKSPELTFSADDWREFQRSMDADDMGNYLGPVWFQQVADDRWEMGNLDCRGALLVFDDGEAEAFMAGLFAGEFTPEVLSAGDGSGAGGSVRGCDGPVAGEDPVSGVPGTP